VAVSEVLGEHLRKSHIAPAARLQIIPNGVPTDVFHPQPDDGALRHELGLSAEAPILGSIGRLEPIKGYDVMIDAFAQLLSAWNLGDLPTLVIAGNGSERSRLESLIDGRGLRGRVHLLGWRSDVQSLHSAFTLFTMSSRSEGTSISLLEAMSAGLCPVVTDVGGNRAVLGDQLSRRLVPAGDAQALCRAWREALCNVERRRHDESVARRRVEAAYGSCTMIAKYELLYATP
jgi:glycosyltransferase involved in cell wall biosynthesis